MEAPIHLLTEPPIQVSYTFGYCSCCCIMKGYALCCMSNCCVTMIVVIESIVTQTISDHLFI